MGMACNAPPDVLWTLTLILSRRSTSAGLTILISKLCAFSEEGSPGGSASVLFGATKKGAYVPYMPTLLEFRSDHGQPG